MLAVNLSRVLEMFWRGLSQTTLDSDSHWRVRTYPTST
jgi:hypothetical protein